MLKRQRQQSPPPTRGTVPLATDPVNLNDLPSSRDFKRRRMAPPVLDGTSRGWNSGFGDDEEQYDNSDNEEDGATDDTHHSALGEYCATNTLLRELHTLNQHRLLFSAPPTKYMPPSVPKTPPYSSLDNPFSPFSKASVQQRLGSTDYHDSPFSREHLPGAGDEMTHVLKRYEGTNKLLGELFLSRRRDMGSSSGPYPP